jgi:hypothetical protein
VAAVLLACASAALFGAMSVAVRFAVRRFDDVELGSLAMSSVALALTAAICLVAARGTDLVDAWPFLVSGAIAPGASQIFFVRAGERRGRGPHVRGDGDGAPGRRRDRADGAARARQRRAARGRRADRRGGVALANERVRPADFRRLGVLFAVTATVLFAVRDNVLRAIAKGSDVDPLAAAAVSLLAGAMTVAVYLTVTRRGAWVRGYRRAGRRLRRRGGRLRAFLCHALRGLLRGPRQRRRAAGGRPSRSGASAFSALLLRRSELVRAAARARRAVDRRRAAWS